MIRLFAVVAIFALVGCGAQNYTAKTSVHVRTSSDGTCEAEYASDKEQQGLKAEVCGGKIEVDKSGTLESVVAAQAASTAALIKILETLTTMIPAGARAGALSGS